MRLISLKYTLLSKACSYGLLAMMHVARANRKNYVPIREICAELGISFHFLTKILRTLAGAGLVNSHTGPKGGISLAKQPSEISLLEIIHAIDGATIFSECILGLQGCGHTMPCPMHNQWTAARELLQKQLHERNLSDTTQDLERFGLRLRTG